MTRPAFNRIVFTDVTLLDRPGRYDVTTGESITALVAAGQLTPHPSDEVIAAAGRTLIPGLHDHHIHLLALAAARESVACGGLDPAEFDARLQAAAPRSDGWIRAVGFHEQHSGELDKVRLDQLRRDVPVRVQDASGAAWYLNSPGLARLGLEPIVSDGVLTRMDDLISEATGSEGILRESPQLAAVGAELAAWGVTGLTDATPDLQSGAVAALAAAHRQGALPQRLTVMAAAADAEPDLRRGPEKILLSDHLLPGFEYLASRIGTAHERGPVAVHCVTRQSLALLVAVLGEIGAVPGDRVEHASVAPPDLVDCLVELGVTVVTQPNFVAERGDRYLADVESEDLPWLYRCGGLLAAGLEVAAGTDAPFGDPNPWRAVRAAMTRRADGSGRVLGPSERLDSDRSLDLFLGPAERPGGPRREVAVGAAGDLCLLSASWRELAPAPPDESVAVTAVGGRIIHHHPSLR